MQSNLIHEMIRKSVSLLDLDRNCISFYSYVKMKIIYIFYLTNLTVIVRMWHKFLFRDMLFLFIMPTIEQDLFDARTIMHGANAYLSYFRLLTIIGLLWNLYMLVIIYFQKPGVVAFRYYYFLWYYYIYTYVSLYQKLIMAYNYETSFWNQSTIAAG